MHSISCAHLRQSVHNDVWVKQMSACAFVYTCKCMYTCVYGVGAKCTILSYEIRIADEYSFP